MEIRPDGESSQSINEVRANVQPNILEDKVTPPSSNLQNFNILKSQQVGHSLVVSLQSVDCDNFEGRRICVYSGTDIETLIKHGSVDPEFSNDETLIRPCASFKPTAYGWELALKTALQMDKDFIQHQRFAHGIFI